MVWGRAMPQSAALAFKLTLSCFNHLEDFTLATSAQVPSLLLKPFGSPRNPKFQFHSSHLNVTTSIQYCSRLSYWELETLQCDQLSYDFLLYICNKMIHSGVAVVVQKSLSDMEALQQWTCEHFLLHSVDARQWKQPNMTPARPSHRWPLVKNVTFLNMQIYTIINKFVNILHNRTNGNMMEINKKNDQVKKQMHPPPQFITVIMAIWICMSSRRVLGN